MLIKELLEWRHYGARPRKPSNQYDTNGGPIKTRKRMAKKPTEAKRRRDRLIRKRESIRDRVNHRMASVASQTV